MLAGSPSASRLPSIQIGALSGVKGEHIGFASGLVETTREIGGAFAIAVVSTVLVSQSLDVAGGRSVYRAAGIPLRLLCDRRRFAGGAIISSVGFPSRMPAVRPEDEFQTDDDFIPEVV